MLRHLQCASIASKLETLLTFTGCSHFFWRRKGTNVEQISQNILRETKISTAHLTSEIALHLITPECALFHKPICDESEKVFENDPFWGFYWPGGQALSRYILDNAAIVENKSVLDVGSGCGASSLAAIMCGAKYTVANDIDEVAGIAAQLNTELNNLPNAAIQNCTENLIGTAVPEDVILLGDVFYDEDFAEMLIPWLQKLLKLNKIILIGDPGRHALNVNRLAMEKLATYELTENGCIENNGFKFVNIWRCK